MHLGHSFHIFTQECSFEVSSGPRAVGAVRITPVATMKGSPDLIPAAGDAPTSLIFQVQQVLDITYSQRKAWPLPVQRKENFQLLHFQL